MPTANGPATATKAAPASRSLLPEPSLCVGGSGDGAIMAAHLSLDFRLAFLSCLIVSERSSSSRVRFAAPNNGAPLTTPGRSEKRLLIREKGFLLNGYRSRKHHAAIMAPFLTATDSL